MAMSYLPVHPRMFENYQIKKGDTLAINSGGKYQGCKAVVSIITDNHTRLRVYLRNNDQPAEVYTQIYKNEWLVKNSWIFIGDIKRMGGAFNGNTYLEKYQSYARTISELRKSKCHGHELMKRQADLLARESGADGVPIHPDSTCSGNVDSMDVPGVFHLVHRGKMLSSHTTQRLAEIAASKFSKENRCSVGILKLVAEAVPRCESDIIRK